MPQPGRSICDSAMCRMTSLSIMAMISGQNMRLGHMRVDIDQEIVLALPRLLGGVGQDVARIGAGGDLGEGASVGVSLEHV